MARTATTICAAGAQNDRVFGGPGNDYIEGEGGDDLIDGGDGTDTASYASAAAAVTVDLARGDAQPTGRRGGSTRWSASKTCSAPRSRIG